ncbi:hypothetical protein D6D10_02640 [Aureobasidium pullulans]|uniref:BTB domain-containing protein n=1 Tax=Aureobasidium pullulans TaxID=5580 RepID=A0A4S9F4S6_AURPU|nr:hypothetical protein D6D10_02640 [Aureobasidium pullulans]
MVATIMADTSPLSSRSVSPQPDDWQQSDISAADLSSWESERFQAHFGMSVLKEQVFLNGLRTTMWDDRSNADFEIRCGNKKFKIHKTIIRAHSDVLAKACDNRSFEASPSYPTLSGILDLKAHPYNGNLNNLGDGDDPEIVEEMVHFFYHLELSPKARGMYRCATDEELSGHSLILLARIYVLAEKYFIEALKAKVLHHFSYMMRCLIHPELVEACHIIYKKTVEPAGEHGLKTTVAKALARDWSTSKKSGEHDKLLQEIPELAFRVLKELPDSPCRHGYCFGEGHVAVLRTAAPGPSW